MNNLSKAAALVGAAESNEIGYPDEPRTSLQLHIEAIKALKEISKAEARIQAAKN